MMFRIQRTEIINKPYVTNFSRDLKGLVDFEKVVETT